MEYGALYPYTLNDCLKNVLLPLATSVAIIFVLFILVTAIFEIMTQISILKSAVAELSSGNADLTKRVQVTGKSFFRVLDGLVEEVNRFIIKFQDIIGTVKKSEEKLNVVGSDMGTSMEEATASIQVSNVEETAGAVSEISGNIENLEQMIQEQGVSSASSAVAEMVENIRSVNKTVDNMATSFTPLESESHAGQEKQKAVNDKIQQIFHFCF